MAVFSTKLLRNSLKDFYDFFVYIRYIWEKEVTTFHTLMWETIYVYGSKRDTIYN